MKSERLEVGESRDVFDGVNIVYWPWRGGNERRGVLAVYVYLLGGWKGEWLARRPGNARATISSLRSVINIVPCW
jgi:hypothetical protein